MKASHMVCTALASLVTCASLAGCHAVVPANDRIRFGCTDSEDCLRGEICFEKYCYARGELPHRDGSSPGDATARDRSLDGAIESGADAARDAGLDATADGGSDAAADAAATDGAAADAAAADAAAADSAPWDAGWWNYDWSDRVKLTFDNSQQGELTDFPVMVRVNGRRVDYTKIQNNGNDIRFVDADNRTLLDHEVERWVDNSEGIYWVRVPRIDAASTSDHIWLYYGNAATGSAAHAAGVWTPSFRAVWHLSDSTACSLPDVPAGATSGGYVNGIAARAKHFNGTSEGVRISKDPNVLGTLDSFTVGAWIKPDQIGTNWYGVVSARHDNENDSDSGNWVMHTDEDEFGFESSPTAQNSFRRLIATPLSWHFVATAVDAVARTVTLYLDGLQVGQLNSVAIQSYADQNYVEIGRRFWSGNLDFFFDGAIDEVRVAAVARDAGWLRAEYLTATDAFIQWPEPTAWWNTAFAHRLRIDFQSPGQAETLLDYPVLVRLGASAVDWRHVESDGADLRFVDPDGTELPYEIESWAHGVGAAIWVKVPQLNAYNITDHIWLYFGNGAAAAPTNAAETWDSEYIGVFHLNGDGNNASTGMNDGVAYNVTAVPGAVGNGYEFDRAAGEAVIIADNASLDSMGSQFTVSAWVKPYHPALDYQVAVSREWGTGSSEMIWLGVHQSTAIWSARLGTGAVDVDVASGVTANVWAHLAGLYNGRRTMFMIDGVVRGQQSVNAVMPHGNQEVAIGANSNDDGATWVDNFDGVIDEVRISKAVRSPVWIETDQRALASALVVLGSEETR
ncbi:MAG: DUF2341 domain-containing protein [Deltaproteobacteria bacterium]|nr:DUF2341 domain-containing protein [Deltaproteobacteria bacterium]